MTFSGRSSVTIPANAIVYSDAVALTVPPLSDLAVDVYLPGTTNTPAPLAMHTSAFQTSYISETGNHAGMRSCRPLPPTRSWFLLRGSKLTRQTSAGVIVAFGDSITDGAASTPDTNSRWPDVLARRLLCSPTPVKMGIVNAGIGGNRVLSEGAYGAGVNALARFEVDALSQSGVTHVIVMEGINDIGNARQNPTPTAEDLIAAHKQLIARAHARGVKILGATLTPFWGAGYYTDVGEAKRQALNEWIRTARPMTASSTSTKRPATRAIRRRCWRPTIPATTCIPAMRDIRRWERLLILNPFVQEQRPTIGETRHRTTSLRRIEDHRDRTLVPRRGAAVETVPRRRSVSSKTWVCRLGFADSRRPGPSLYVAVCGRRDAVLPRNVQKDPGNLADMGIEGRDHPARQGLLREARARQNDVSGAAHDSAFSRRLGLRRVEEKRKLSRMRTRPESAPQGMGDGHADLSEKPA